MNFRKLKIWVIAVVLVGVLLGINLQVQQRLDHIITEKKLVDEAFEF